MPLPESKHFHLEPLTDGVYAALAKETGIAGSNAGIIDLGDGALIFDAFMAPQAARDLVQAAQQITGQPVTVAVNSHWHLDHVGGNSALPAGTHVLSTHRTRELMAEHIPGMVAQQRQNVPAVLKDLEKRLQTEKDPDRQRGIGESIDSYRMILEDLPRLQVRLPQATFDRRMVVHGPQRRVELLTFGGGHTESDGLLYLPDEQIAFVGDLLFNDCHPWLGDGDPDEWMAIYTQIEALDPALEVIVPGHGAVTTPMAFAHLRRYVPALRQLVAQLIEQGRTIEEAAAAPVPAAFSTWGGPQTFANNVRYFYRQLSAGVEGD